MNMTMDQRAGTLRLATFRRLMALLSVSTLVLVCTYANPIGANTNDSRDARTESTADKLTEVRGSKNQVLENLDKAKAALEKGDSNSSILRIDLGHAYRRAGMDKEALEEYLWTFDEGPKYAVNRSYSAVRGSFLLGYIRKLANDYPPAMDALVERRDSLFKAILGNEPEYLSNKREFDNDFCALARAIHDEDYTLSVLNQLEYDPTTDRTQTLQRFVQMNLDTFDRHGLFDAIVKYVDLRKEVESKIRSFLSLRERGSDHSAESFFRKRLANTYKILLATNRSEDANYAAEQIIGLFDDAETYNTLALAAIESKNPSDKNVDQARKAVELEPSNANFVDTLVQLLHTTGSNSEAVETGQNFLNTDPSPRDAELIENTLKRIQ